MSSVLNTVDWRKPSITIQQSQRIRIARSAIEEALSNLGGNGTFSGDYYHSALLYSHMAEFDLLSNGTRYKDQLSRYLQMRAGETLSTSLIQDTRYLLELGHAAIRAHKVYKDDTFLKLAEDWWQWTLSWAISDSAVASKTASGKSAPLPSECLGHSIVGGIFHVDGVFVILASPSSDSAFFQDTDPANAYVGIFPTGNFLVLSSLLAEATGNRTYLAQANQAFAFVQNLLLNPTTMIPQDRIYLNASAPNSCSTNPPPSLYPSGVWIDGLSAFSTVSNGSSKPDDQLISKSYIGAMTVKDWHSADGILRVPAGDGKSYHADVNMVWGLGMLYQRTANVKFKSDVEKYLAVQYNAVLELSTTNGSNIYPWDWIGPPPSTFDLNGQITALGVLVPVIALPDTDSPSSDPTSSRASSSPSKTPVGGIVGGVVGGMLALAALVVLLLRWRHRRKKSLLTQNCDTLDQTQNHIEPFNESLHPLAPGSGFRSSVQHSHKQPFTEQRLSVRWGSAVGQRESTKEGVFRKTTLDSERMSQPRPPLSNLLMQDEQQDERHLLRQMDAALSNLNRRLTRVEEASTAGGETDEPPEYPGSVHS